MKKWVLIILLILSIKSVLHAEIILNTTTSSSRNIIAATIYKEARGEDTYGMCLVASVIYNRSKERNISAKEVCLQRKQFSCWNGVSSMTLIFKNKQDQDAWDCALTLATDFENGRFKPFISANHYYNPSICSPSWGNQLKDVEVYKNHKFGRL